MLTGVCSSFHLTQVLVDNVKVLPVLFKNLLDPVYPFSDQISTILSNLTRHEKTCKTVFQVNKVETFNRTRIWLTWLDSTTYL